jgi:hypothetical protein
VLRFAIRDDDTSYFTRPEQILRPYQGLWNTVPISLSVVPFHGRTRTGAIPPAYWEPGSELYPVADNGEIVAFLREQCPAGRVAIALHGFSHVDENDGFEFETGPDLERKAREGHAYLERLLGTRVHVFVPPHNALSARGYRAVVAAGLDITPIVRFGRGARPVSLGDLVPLARVVSAGLRGNGFYPHVLDFGDHREVACRSLTPSVTLQQRLLDLEFCHRQGGVFVLATHYWELDEVTRDGVRLRDALARLVDRAAALGARFCSVNKVLGRQ